MQVVLKYTHHNIKPQTNKHNRNISQTIDLNPKVFERIKSRIARVFFETLFKWLGQHTAISRLLFTVTSFVNA